MREKAPRGGPRTGSERIAHAAVIECGRIAHRVLAAETEGTVSAVFRRSCYVDFAAGRMICVGDRSLGRGPLNAHVEGFEPPSVGATLGLNARRAALWRPSAARVTPRRGALAALRAAALERVPSEGLGGLVCGIGSPLIDHARPGVDALERWLERGELGDEVDVLLGLGPGLTPSGDDYLGGVLIALRLFGRAEDADALWRWLGPRLPARTSRISAAHLAAAAGGEAHESLHACIDALGDDRPAAWEQPLARLASVGHCSGWDGLAGVIAVADRVAQ